MKSSKKDLDKVLKGKERHLILEVGNYNTKMIEVVPEERKINVEKGFIFATPVGTIEDDVIVSYDELIEELMARMKEEKITSKFLTVSLSSMDIITRELNAPEMTKKDIVSFVKNNAPDIFPVDLFDYTLAYTSIEAKRGSSKLLIAAIPNEIIAPYIKIAEKLGLILKSLSFSGYGLYNLFDLETGFNAGTYAVIDLGSKNTNFIIVSDGMLMYNRVLKVGSDDITKEIAMHFKCTLTKGEKLKRDYNSVIIEGSLKADDPVYVVADIFRNVLGGMLSDISNLIEFYNSNHQKHMVSKVYIIGIASKISGICEYVQTTLGIETEKIKSFDRVVFGERAIKNLKPRQVTLETCLGAVPLGGKKITLIKGDLQLAKWYQTLDPIVYKIGVMIACLMILGLCIINVWTHGINQDIKKYERLMASKSGIIELQAKLLNITEENEEQLETFNSVPSGIEMTLQKLTAIEDFLKDYPTIQLGNYKFDKKTLTIRECSAPDEWTYWSLEEALKEKSWDCVGEYSKFSMIFTFSTEAE